MSAFREGGFGVLSVGPLSLSRWVGVGSEDAPLLKRLFWPVAVSKEQVVVGAIVTIPNGRREAMASRKVKQNLRWPWTIGKEARYGQWDSPGRLLDKCPGALILPEAFIRAIYLSTSGVRYLPPDTTLHFAVCAPGSSTLGRSHPKSSLASPSCKKLSPPVAPVLASFSAFPPHPKLHDPFAFPHALYRTMGVLH